MTDPPSPPHNLEAERVTLGAILINPKMFEVAAAVLGEDEDRAWWLPEHGTIWHALRALHQRGVVLDLVTLKAELGDRLESVGGPAYLAAILDGVPRSSNVAHYARIVQEHGIRRWLAGAGAAASPAAIYAALDRLSGADIAAARFDLAADPEPEEPPPLPKTIIGFKDAALLPAGEVGLLASAGGAGKSRLTLQIAAAAAGAIADYADPFPGRGRHDLRIASGPVLMVGWEDAAPWVTLRARAAAEHLDRRAGGSTNRHRFAISDPERLSVAVLDEPIYGIRATDRREEALPRPLHDWRPLWDRAAEMGARLIVIDPAGLALAVEGYSPLPVGMFVNAIRRELRALDHPAACWLVVHTGKGARFGVKQDGSDRTGAEGILGSVAWVDRARCALMLDRVKQGHGRARLSIAKANYAASDVPVCDLETLTVNRRPVAFEPVAPEREDAEDNRPVRLDEAPL